MGRLFNLDSPIVRALNTIADLCWLNILTLICSLPIVTAGASFTAMHYVMLKLVRNEEGYVTKSFFKSFKENFRQATCIWLVVLLFVLFFLGDCYIFLSVPEGMSKVLMVILCAFGLFLYMIILYVFPILSHFTNSVFGTLKNSFLVGIMAFPKTLMMMLLYIAPYLMVYQYPRTLPLLIMFGITIPAYASAFMYSGTFKKLEPKAIEAETAEEEIAEEETENAGEDIDEQ